MIVKSTLLAVVVFLGSLSLAEAQTFVNGGVPGPNTALGWNFGHIAYCTTYNDGTTTLHYAFFDGGGYAFCAPASLYRSSPPTGHVSYSVDGGDHRQPPQPKGQPAIRRS